MRTILLLLLACPAWLMGQGYGGYISHQMQDEANTLQIQTQRGTLLLTPMTPQHLRVDFRPDGLERYNPSDAVVLPANTSMPVNLEEQGSQLLLSWEGYTLIYNKRKGTFEIVEDDEEVIADHGYFDGRREGIRFGIDKDDPITGGGFRALPLDRRGYVLPLDNQPQYGYELGWKGSNFSLPYFQVEDDVAIFFDNPARGEADLGAGKAQWLDFRFAAGGPMTYYLIFGDSYPDLTTGMAQLTGTQPMPPRWALGNFASRFGYQSQQETEDIVQAFRQDSIPLDAVIIDLYWFGKGVHDSFYMGNLDWDYEAWPQPDSMIARIRAQEVNTILIAEPFIMQESGNFNATRNAGLLATGADDKAYIIEDFWFGPTGLLDIFKPEAQQWFWQQYKRQAEIGVAGWWGDLGEPEKHPSGMRHVNGPADLVHNVYGHTWSKMLTEGYAFQYPDTRLFHLNRSGFAGSPRYNGYPWSGDVHRSWKGFEAQLPIMLGMALCGVPYMHSDLGGFAMGERDPELYVRWLQMGVFNPIYRPHGSGIPSEPVNWDDATKAIAKQAIELRYRMMPYNYTLAHEAEVKGYPLARPMVWQDEDAELTYEQYYWGDALLVKPVIKKGATSVTIDQPEGDWFVWDTRERIGMAGPVTLPVDITSIPVLVQGGSILFLKPVFQSTTRYPDAVFDVEVYLHNGSGQAAGYVYEDDGHTRDAYNKGLYQQINMDVAVDEGTLSVDMRTTGNGYAGMPASRSYRMAMYGLSEMPASVQLNGGNTWEVQPIGNGEPSDAMWDDGKKVLYFTFSW